MVEFNISLLQYYLYRKINELMQSSSAAGMDYSFSPTVFPKASVFSGVSDPESYARYIQSCYRFCLVSDNNIKYIFYFFFRNGRASDGSYTRPSSIEIGSIVNSAFCPLWKSHYFSGDATTCMFSFAKPLFSTADEMKQYITGAGTIIVSAFKTILLNGGVIK